mmetsp:Transcript_69104/g.165751  ORF Transcript_69104/g.165751 Transcript_69104/m.165751 type:complete len:482 (-) Transcript_69104:124-1569(-)
MAAPQLWDAEILVAQIALAGTRPTFKRLLVSSASLWHKYEKLLRELAWPRSILLLGGFEAGQDYERAANFCKHLNQRECRWQDLRPLPVPHYGFEAVTDGDSSVYVVGGLAALAPPYRQKDSEWCTDLNCFNLNTGKWRSLPPMPSCRRQFPAMLGDELYVFCEVITPHLAAMATYCYCIKSQQWSRKASLPIPDTELSDQHPYCYERHLQHVLAVTPLNGSIYVCVTDQFEEITKLYCFHPSEDDAHGAWEALADLPTCRYYPFPVQAIGGLLFAIGGHLESRESQQLFEIDSYDPVTQQWTSCAPLPYGLEDHQAAVVDDMLFVVGGTRGGYAPCLHPFMQDALQHASVLAVPIADLLGSRSSGGADTCLPWSALGAENDPFGLDWIIWMHGFSVVSTYADLGLPMYVGPAQYLHLSWLRVPCLGCGDTFTRKIGPSILSDLRCESCNRPRHFPDEDEDEDEDDDDDEEEEEAEADEEQ